MAGKLLVSKDEEVEVLRQQLTDARRSPETVRQYVNCLCVLQRKVGLEVPLHKVDLWARVPNCMPYLQKLTLSSAKSQVAVILVALRKWPRAREAWTPLWCQLTQRLEARQQKGLMTARERSNWVSSEELHEKLRELDSLCAAMKRAITCSQRRTVLSWTVLSLLVRMPAVRTGNLSDVRVVDSRPRGRRQHRKRLAQRRWEISTRAPKIQDLPQLWRAGDRLPRPAECSDGQVFQNIPSEVLGVLAPAPGPWHVLQYG